MSKKQELKPAGSTALAGVSADQLNFLADHSGHGAQRVSMQDIVMPRINILQDLSPQLKPNKPEYVEGAKRGQLFNAATRRVMDALNVLPCAYIRHYIEWRPNRGGFVADHGEGGEALMAQTKRNDDHFDVLPSGNLLIPTPTWYCLDLDNGGQQIVIPMPRTQARTSKSWMSQATSERVNPRDLDPNDSRPVFQPPLYYRSWTLGSTIREDGENDWFVFTVNPGPNVIQLGQPELLPMAANFAKLIESGEVRADASSFADEGQGVGGGSSNEDRAM